MNKNILFAAVLVATFSFGYVVNDIVDKTNLRFVGVANADVAGMDYNDLKRDSAFKKAVLSVVDGNCYVEKGSEYVYC